MEKMIKQNGQFGVFTRTAIKEGELLFSSEDWVSDEEKGWETLSVEQILELPPKDSEIFLRYAYDKDFGKIIGTFDWSRALHVSNFINHSCHPNMVYDRKDNIIAFRDIAPGTELTLDYGNFIVNVDQTFKCTCNQTDCRIHIKKDDWKFLITKFGFGFPKFMHNAISTVMGIGMEGVV